MPNPPAPTPHPPSHEKKTTPATGVLSTGTGNRTSPFPPPSSKAWWLARWSRALGPEPADQGSAPPDSLRFVGLKKPLPIDLAWERVGAPSPTWPPRFLPLWEQFNGWLQKGGLPTPLDVENVWVIACPSADRELGLAPVLISLPPDQVPAPGCTIIARRPQDQRPSETFTVSPLGGFRLPPGEAEAAAPGAVASASALIGEVWRM